MVGGGGGGCAVATPKLVIRESGHIPSYLSMILGAHSFFVFFCSYPGLVQL